VAIGGSGCDLAAARSLPRYGSRVGLRIVLFEACSAFTRVAACTLALSPFRDTLIRRLQPLRYLHDCSGCFRLERCRVGLTPTGKAPPLHGAPKSGLSLDAILDPGDAIASLLPRIAADPERCR
jgi:hypothetical protein